MLAISATREARGSTGASASMSGPGACLSRWCSFYSQLYDIWG